MSCWKVLNSKKANGQRNFRAGGGITLVLGLALAGSTGCALDEDQSDLELSDIGQEATQDNGLPNNGLPNNGLPNNGLPNNGLPNNGLPNNGLANNGLPSTTVDAQWSTWLTDATRGELNAKLMGYMVRCALPSGTTASYTSGTQTWTWPGQMGVAPAWQTGAITSVEQQRITGCVLSLVNGSGVSITISQRGKNSSGAMVYSLSFEEVQNYSMSEGAFYGNMFDSTPRYYACRHVGADGSRWEGRVCAGGNCAPIAYTGYCTSACDSSTYITSYSKTWNLRYNCRGDGVVYRESTSTYLRPY